MPFDDPSALTLAEVEQHEILILGTGGSKEFHNWTVLLQGARRCLGPLVITMKVRAEDKSTVTLAQLALEGFKVLHKDSFVQR